ncbi:alpha/beta hydrolase [Psychroserpens burtonensis]|uniref:Alpha/beta hydrolase n=1 Tax=Psychroserpens burtonensis TaxID=49278 RepID=A0A5C7B7M2_9FLAO|nr:alpha/beta hydrolase [Psychroserpens burtonensis]TXE16151.1 alpha/beta hydrolase [Psychroserpens burtonensis]
MRQVIVKTIGCFINITSILSPKLGGKIALKLFSKPRKIKLKELEKDFLMTAFTEDIDYKNLNIMTYRWLGKKDTILLAHGWESNSFRWKSLIERLKKLDYNIVALDAPAHGRSSGKLFNAVLYAECIHIVAKKFNANIIIGHSVGGMATAFCKSKYELPSVNKLILLGAPSNFVGVFSRYTAMMGYNKRVSRAMDELIHERFKEKPEHFNAARFLENEGTQGLLIHDKKDRIIPYSDAEDFKNYFKNATLISTEGFGHGLRHEEVNNHIIDFVNA